MIFYPSAMPFLSDWLCVRANTIFQHTRDFATSGQITLQRILITGFEFYEEHDRQLVITFIIDEPDEGVWLFWDNVARYTHAVNQKSPPRHAKKADVQLRVAVEWDVQRVVRT